MNHKLECTAGMQSLKEGPRYINKNQMLACTLGVFQFAVFDSEIYTLVAHNVYLNDCPGGISITYCIENCTLFVVDNFQQFLRSSDMLPFTMCTCSVLVENIGLSLMTSIPCSH